MTYPTSWKKYCDSVDTISFEWGKAGEKVKVTRADINRWAARFRAARAFRGVLLEGYSDSVVSGYSGLCQMVFTWSAFERFLPIIGLKQVDCGSLFLSEQSEIVKVRVAELDAKCRFYDFVYEKCDGKHQKYELSKWRSQEPHNFSYLASAIRHIFAHGHLTPSVDGTDPKYCAQICDIVSNHLLDVMDNKFTEIVERSCVHQRSHI